ncbi:MAG: inorganic diphosphatase [Gammaproteobacteria bacterium]|nr:inorganic diphosphatase [Gammaproteobacteria bacterium]
MSISEFNVKIEIPVQSSVKYEVCKDTNEIIVDRFLTVNMFYPANYGFIPDTLSEDGDPCDVLVFTRFPLISGCIIKCRPIGVLLMEDESGNDEKIISVPISKVDASFDHIKSVSDMGKETQESIKHFFEYYKKLEKEKWVKVKNWGEKEKAIELIKASIDRFKN